MKRRLSILLLLATSILLLAAAPASASAPAWKLTVTPIADYFAASPEDHNAVYTLEAENVGDAPTDESQPIVIEDIPPAGLGGEGVRFLLASQVEANGNAPLEFDRLGLCPSALRCEYPGPLAGEPEAPPVRPGDRLIMLVQIPASFPDGALVDRATVSGGGAAAVETSVTNTASSRPVLGFHGFLAALEADGAGSPATQAGAHPYQFVTHIDFSTKAELGNSQGLGSEGGISPVGDPKDIVTDLPPGLIGNPQAVPSCSLADYFAEECPLQTVVGTVGLRIAGGSQGAYKVITPLFNLHPDGAHPGELGFTVAGGFNYLLAAGLRSAGDYGITVTSLNSPEAALSRADVTVWGVPADPSHDQIRGKDCKGVGAAGFGNWNTKFVRSRAQAEAECEGEPGDGAFHGGPAGYSPATAFLTLPTSCPGSPLTISAHYNSWENPAEEAEASYQNGATDECESLRFEPEIREARPTTNRADSPAGFDFDLHIPQAELSEPAQRSQADLRDAEVTLPKGFTVNPSSANGLAACSTAQIGLTTPVGTLPAHFTEAPAACPDASKVATAEVDTPLLDEPLGKEGSQVGAVYLATPGQNPYGSLLAGYIVLEGQGVVIKLAGEFKTDPRTGQITGVFEENPQTPFEDFHLRFFGGARGALRTPVACGEYETTSLLTPWSAPQSGAPATPSAGFAIAEGAAQGSSCPKQESEAPNAPVLRAGTESPAAGAFTPFSLRLAREDGSQEISKVETTLPPGLTGKLAGVGECSDAQLAVAKGREHEGGGAEERANPSCPASSEVGTVEVGAGAGPTPLYVTGHAYLAGPYKGAPLSLAIITPAVAGPFDLGDVLVRTALNVDPETAQIKAVSDPIPHILQGIPLDVRSITLKMSRHEFTLNPTNCSELHLSGTATSVLGNAAPLSQRFQVGGCQALPFKPKLAIKLKGGVKRHTFPALTATLTMPPGGANIASAQVTLPHSALLEQSHIQTVCTRPQLASHSCPAASVYGFAKAETPLLDHPLEGPVYLGTGFGYKLPALVADLNGQIEVLLHGKVDTGREDGLRNTFEVVPDAPVSKFTLSMFGGKRGLIVNSENLCGPRAKTKALAVFTAQNGKTAELEPTVKTSCERKGGKHRKGHRRR